jgi:adenosylcobinamide-GDP ribazoletransferase
LSVNSLRSAVAFLTVIPVAAGEGKPPARLGRAYFPAVGAVLGLLAGAVFALVAAIATPMVGAVAAVGVLAALTGGLHLDGVADAADGLFGRGNRMERLEVMRDSRIGSFGAIALILVLVGDVAALSALTPAGAIVALVVACALSRWAMLWVIAFLPYVRESGLGVAARGASRAFDLILGSSLAALVCVLDWRRALLAVVLVGVSALVVSGVARRRIGGATGDIYGATSELSQLAAVFAFAVHV